MRYTADQLAKQIGRERKSFMRRVREFMDEGKFEKAIPNSYGFTEPEVEKLSVLFGFNFKTK